MKAFVSWSGGKETALSCYRIMQRKEILDDRMQKNTIYNHEPNFSFI